MKIHNSARPVTGWFSVGSRSASTSSWEQKTSEKKKWTCIVDDDYLDLSNISWEELMQLFNFWRCDFDLSKDIQSQRYVILIDFAHDNCCTPACFPKKQLMAELMRNPSKWVDLYTLNLNLVSLLVISHWLISSHIPKHRKYIQNTIWFEKMSGVWCGSQTPPRPGIWMCESRVSSDHQSCKPFGKQSCPSQPFSVGLHWRINYPKFLNHALFFTSLIFKAKEREWGGI